MSSTGWGGDLNAAKEFQAKVQRPLDDDRRGRGGARGGRAGSNMTRGSNSLANTSFFTNNGNSRRGGLLTELPSHIWNPVNTHGTHNTRIANAEDRGDPMNIDDHSMGGFQWVPDTRPTAAHASLGQTSVGSAPPAASWCNTNQSTQPERAAPGANPAPWSSAASSHTDIPARAPSNPVRISEPEPGHPTNPGCDRAASTPQGLGLSIHAAANNTNKPRANVAAHSQSATHEQVTWGPRNTPVSNIKPFNSLNGGHITDQGLKDAQSGNTISQGDGNDALSAPSAAEAGHQWLGLRASRHAGGAAPVGHPGSRQIGAPRRDLLQENGMLRGVQFTEDQGPQQDDDWLKTYSLNKVKDKCDLGAKQAFANGDHEAEKALRKVAAACSEVLHAKNVLKDRKREGEADMILSKSQKEAWIHWIRFYHPTAPAANPASIQITDESPNVRMQDAPMVVPSQTKQSKAPSAKIGNQAQAQAQAQYSPAAFAPFAPIQAPAAPQRPNSGGADSGGFNPTGTRQQSSRTAQGDNFDHTPSVGFGSSKSQQLHKSVASQAQVSPQQPGRTARFDGNNPSGGFDSANTSQTQPAQQPQGPQPPTTLTGLPSMFPQGLPADFDDPQARKIFEDFFFQNKHLPQK